MLYQLIRDIADGRKTIKIVDGASFCNTAVIEEQSTGTQFYIGYYLYNNYISASGITWSQCYGRDYVYEWNGNAEILPKEFVIRLIHLALPVLNDPRNHKHHPMIPGRHTCNNPIIFFC